MTENNTPERKAGDKVLIDGAQIAVIDSYNVEANLVTYTTGLAGGGLNTVYAHISNTRIEDLPDGASVLADSVDSEKLAEAAKKQDDINDAHRADHVVAADELAAADAELAKAGKAPLKGQQSDEGQESDEQSTDDGNALTATPYFQGSTTEASESK